MPNIMSLMQRRTFFFFERDYRYRIGYRVEPVTVARETPDVHQCFFFADLAV